MVASVGFGNPTARSFLASTTNRCAASKVLVAWTSTLCRLPSGSVNVTVHQRIDFRLAQMANKRRTRLMGPRIDRTLPSFARLAVVLDHRHLVQVFFLSAEFPG